MPPNILNFISVYFLIACSLHILQCKHARILTLVNDVERPILLKYVKGVEGRTLYACIFLNCLHCLVFFKGGGLFKD